MLTVLTPFSHVGVRSDKLNSMLGLIATASFGGTPYISLRLIHMEIMRPLNLVPLIDYSDSVKHFLRTWIRSFQLKVLVESLILLRYQVLRYIIPLFQKWVHALVQRAVRVIGLLLHSDRCWFVLFKSWVARLRAWVWVSIFAEFLKLLDMIHAELLDFQEHQLVEKRMKLKVSILIQSIYRNEFDLLLFGYRVPLYHYQLHAWLFLCLVRLIYKTFPN